MRTARHAWAVLAAVAAVALFAVPAYAAEGAEPTAARDVKAPPVDVRTVIGTIRSVTWSDHAVTIDTEDGPLLLHFDRNTSVFLEDRVGTVRALHPGARARASFGPARDAFWIEVRPAETAARDRPAEHRSKEGRPVLAAPPDPARGASSAPPRPGDSAEASRPPADEPPGPDVPEPNPGVTPPPPGGMPPVRGVRGG